jgi:hypothetical protein
MIPWIALLTAATWVDVGTIVLSKGLVAMPPSLQTWYASFGLVAGLADILILVLGVALVKLLVPGATGLSLIGLSVGIQVLHDVLFYVGVIRGVPAGQNAIVDLFKRYASEGSWRILGGDAAMIAATAWGMEALPRSLTPDQITWTGLLGLYSLLYLLYTKG